MNVAYLSPFANHLWQSTLFAAVAGVLTLGLQKNRARLRHWVWFAASCKFLIPFSVLIALGGHIRWRPTADTTPSNMSVVLAQVSQPFTAPTVPLASLPAVPATASQLPAVLWAVWGCGFLGMTCSWWVRWRRIQATVCAASPLRLAIPVRAVSSPISLDPGVFGVFRPVLLLPDSIFERLTPAQIDAVIAHELSHVRHRDNLIAAVQMFVETVFWFHPLVWWIGKRMLEERERACDEEVLFLGSQPRVYAEGILNVCKLYTESSLACVSRVTGSNLKKRIETIMHNGVPVRLNFARRSALAVAGIAALAAPIVVGMMNAPAVQAQSTAATRPRFEVASIKPAPQEGPDVKRPGLDVRMLPGGRLSAEKVLLRYFIQNAYGVEPFQISGGPAWINSTHYDIEAKAEGNPNRSQMRLMMQALLEDRFKLKLHHETKELPVYELTAAKGGVKLQEPKQGSCISPDPSGPPLPPVPGQPIPCGRVLMMMSPSVVQMHGGRVSMTELVRVLSNVLGRTVVDKTGFTATFDVHLEFAPDESVGGVPGPPPGPAAANDSTRPVPAPDLHGSIFAAVQEIGLKLKSAKGPVDELIIDSLEKPSAN
jgi:bla regulator protein blaR1